ncbi:MAG TPA: transposase [Terriglobales bacterium]|nr:transposase [Terriglobales bacterium]
MAGAAGAVSAVPDGAWTFPAVGSFRAVGEDPPRAGEETARRGTAGAEGGADRRQFRQRKKRGLAVGKTKRGKGTKIMALATAASLPLAVTVDSASPHESELIDETLAGSFLSQLPERIIGDKAYDSDPLDRHLDQQYGIEMIAPNRGNRGKTQDGRQLRRYKRR